MQIIKNELKQREAVWSRIHWEVVGPIKIQTLQARMVGIFYSYNVLNLN